MSVEHPIKTDITILLTLGAAILAAAVSVLLYVIEHIDVLFTLMIEGFVVNNQTIGWLLAFLIGTIFLVLFSKIMKSLSFARAIAWQVFKASEMNESKQSSIGKEASNSSKQDGGTNKGQKLTLEYSQPPAKTIVIVQNLDNGNGED